MNNLKNTIRSNLREAAFYYVSKYQLPVIPLHGIVDGMCTCGKTCSSPGKHPLIKGGANNSSRNLDQINFWWTKWPYANIGIPTGKKSGIIVLDVDLKGDGIKTLKQLLGNKKIEGTTIARTGSGGYHILFKYENGITNKVRFASGLDIKSDGGFIVVAPSNHKTGDRYNWLNLGEKLVLAEIPEWLKNIISSKSNNDSTTKYLEITSGVNKGARNNSLASLVGYLLKKGLDPQITMNLVLGWNKLNNPPMPNNEVKRTFESILRRHLANKEGFK